MQKPIRFLENKMHLPNRLAWFIVLITGISGLLIIIVFITAELMQGTVYLAARIPGYFRFFADFVEHFFEATLLPLYDRFTSIFKSLSNDHQDIILDEINALTDHFAETGATFIHQTLLKIPTFLKMLPESLTMILFTILATIFISKDWKQIKAIYIKMIPHAANDLLHKVSHQFKKTLSGYIRSQFMLVFITACIIFTGLFLLQIEHALTIALLTSIVDFLPFIGTGIVFIPWIIYLFFTDHFTLTIFISMLYMIIIIQRQLSEPKIVSKSIGLPPLVTLLCLFLAWRFWGLLGVFMAPLLLVILTTFIRAGIFKLLWTFIKGEQND